MNSRSPGALVPGHIGDKFGRRKVLTFTLLPMGVSTFLVGVLPTCDQIGIASPCLLVLANPVALAAISAAFIDRPGAERRDASGAVHHGEGRHRRSVSRVGP